jgi:3-phosphoshikimate 1-carboxyvinyltransferase
MAMALAPLALVTGIITLEDPDVVSKSYPRYWEDLEEAGFGMEWSTD